MNQRILAFENQIKPKKVEEAEVQIMKKNVNLMRSVLLQMLKEEKEKKEKKEEEEEEEEVQIMKKNVNLIRSVLLQMLEEEKEEEKEEEEKKGGSTNNEKECKFNANSVATRFDKIE